MDDTALLQQQSVALHMATAAHTFTNDVPASHDITAIGDHATDDIRCRIFAAQYSPCPQIKPGTCRRIDNRIERCGGIVLQNRGGVHIDSPDFAHGDVVGDEVSALLHVGRTAWINFNLITPVVDHAGG